MRIEIKDSVFMFDDLYLLSSILYPRFSVLGLLLPIPIQRPPDCLGPYRQLRDARTSRVADRVGDRRGPGGDWRLADAACAEWAVRRGVLHQDSLDIWYRVRLWHVIIHKRTGQQLAVLVVDHRLVQPPADTLDHAAVNLALDHHRVECEAHILDGDVLLQRDVAGLGIDLDLRQVNDETGRVLLDRRAPLADDRPRAAGLALGHASQFADRDRSVGHALDLHDAIFDLQVVGRRLEMVGR